MKRALAAVGLVSLFLLHNDFWNWERTDLVLGLPVGLLYHGLFCIAVALFMALLLRSERSAQPPS